MRLAIITLSAAATLMAPALSQTASATCWLECRKPIIRPTLPEPDAMPQSTESPELVSTACDDAGPSTALAAVPSPIGGECPPERTWTCCSPPGGPACCTPPIGGQPICSGGGGPEEPVEVASTEVLECRADEAEPSVAMFIVQLFSLWA